LSKPGSLLRQLLAWLLIPLIALLALNAFLSYRAALTAANEAYDRLLLASVRAIADRVALVDDRVEVDVPYVALELFESKSQERIFYRVATRTGATITGYDDLPLPQRRSQVGQSEQNDQPVFYRAPYRDELVYFAALSKPLYDPQGLGPVLIQVGATAEARDALSREILLDSLARQGLLIVAAALVVWAGLRRGLRPMLRLRDHIAHRAPNDLTPIDPRQVQNEVRPLIDAFNLHAERLDTLIAARRRFLDDASHQLRTPLAALKTQADFSLGDPSESDRRQLLHDIRQTTEQTIRLVNQLLVLARAEPQGVPGTEIAPVDLVELARSTTAELVPNARRKQIDLGFDAEAGPGMVDGNRLLLHELIVNLVDNAIRYTQPGGAVTVAITRSNGGVALEVSDNGPGIPEQERERVFERFYRGSTASDQGSGLGLSIVRDICRSHGAGIELAAAGGGRGLLVRVGFGRR
jgi:two-component system sensor histidine kinase TctE